MHHKTTRKINFPHCPPGGSGFKADPALMDFGQSSPEDEDLYSTRSWEPTLLAALHLHTVPSQTPNKPFYSSSKKIFGLFFFVFFSSSARGLFHHVKKKTKSPSQWWIFFSQTGVSFCTKGCRNTESTHRFSQMAGSRLFFSVGVAV